MDDQKAKVIAQLITNKEKLLQRIQNLKEASMVNGIMYGDYPIIGHNTINLEFCGEELREFGLQKLRDELDRTNLELIKIDAQEQIWKVQDAPSSSLGVVVAPKKKNWWNFTRP